MAVMRWVYGCYAQIEPESSHEMVCRSCLFLFS